MYVRAHVIPDARRERVVRENDTTFSISVREPASRNLANNRVRELIASAHHVSVRKVLLVSGHRSPTKMFAVDSG